VLQEGATEEEEEEEVIEHVFEQSQLNRCHSDSYSEDPSFESLS
jgi:hypothetical protein